MRRIWLHDVGIFEIVPNSGHGSCLFQAISQALTFSTEFHHKIRTATVEHMTGCKWAHKLNQFPDFWKHKIIIQWLRKEKAHFMRLKNHHCHHHGGHGSGFTAVVCCRHCMEKFKEKRRRRRYTRVTGFLQKRKYNFCSKDFASIFYKFMRRKNEPGTKFELEAAANLFRFHFDYLQMTPMENGIMIQDILNNNDDDEELRKTIDPAQLQQQQSISTENCGSVLDDNANDTSPFVNDPLPVPNPNESNENQNKNVITVKMAMYQFYSCRNNDCQFPRCCIKDWDHYYFLHSPMQNPDLTNSNFQTSIVESQCYAGNNECGHWELLIPVSLK